MPFGHARRLSEQLFRPSPHASAQKKGKAKQEDHDQDEEVGRPYTPTPTSLRDRTNVPRSIPPLPPPPALPLPSTSRSAARPARSGTMKSASKVPLPPSPVKTPLRTTRRPTTPGSSFSLRPQTPFDDSMLTFRSPESTPGLSLFVPGKSFLGRRKSTHSTSSFGGSSLRSLGTFASRRKSHVGRDENGQPGASPRKKGREDLTWRVLREELEGYLGEGQIIERCLTEVEFDDGEEGQALKEAWDESVWALASLLSPPLPAVLFPHSASGLSALLPPLRSSLAFLALLVPCYVASPSDLAPLLDQVDVATREGKKIEAVVEVVARVGLVKFELSTTNAGGAEWQGEVKGRTGGGERWKGRVATRSMS